MEDPTPYGVSSPAAPPPAPMPLVARLLNVFAMPGEVFAGVKVRSISIGNWLVPALLSSLVFVLVMVVSQPALQKRLREGLDQQAKVIEQQVKAGKVQRAEADRTLALGRAITQPAVVQVVGGAAAAVFGVARVFWWALILWVLARRFLQAPVGYIKALEVAGLALMISVLDLAIRVLLTLNVSKLFAAPSLAVVASDFDLRQQSTLQLGVSTGFALWLVAVLGVGLGKLAGVPWLRAAWYVLAVWIIQEFSLLLFGGIFG